MPMPSTAATAPAPIPAHVPAYRAEWAELGGDSAPVARCQEIHASGGGDLLTAALLAEVRAGRVIDGRVFDMGTGEILAEYPAYELPAGAASPRPRKA